MTFTFGSACSGIEAASVAWTPLGWRCAFVSEVDPAPAAVLMHRQGATRPLFPLNPDDAGTEKDRRQRAAWAKRIARMPEGGALPNYGDMSRFEEWPDHAIDVFVAGTPCQSFSVAGLRKGLSDPRGALMLKYVGVVARYRPRWLVWENVPGVLSSGKGRDFASFLGLLSGQKIRPPNGERWKNSGIIAPGTPDAYGLAWRVLDAQHFGVPQRRRRVFVVGYLGDWRPAAAVLFERDCLRRDSAPRRKARENTAPTISARTYGGGGLGTDAECDGALIPQGTFPASTQAEEIRKAYTADEPIPLNDVGGVSHALTARHSASGRYDPNGETWVAHTLKGGGFDASEDGTGRGVPLVPLAFMSNASFDGGENFDIAPTLRAATGAPPAIAFQTSGNCGAWETGDKTGALDTGTDPNSHVICFTSKDHGADAGDLAPTLRAMGHAQSHANAGGQLAVAMNLRGREGGAMPELDDKASIRAASGGSSRSYVAQSAVRRLTPRECERLQGFPDDYTRVPERVLKAKPKTKHFARYPDLYEENADGTWTRFVADGPRYKQCGNSMAVPVMAWIGERIALVHAVAAAQERPSPTERIRAERKSQKARTR